MKNEFGGMLMHEDANEEASNDGLLHKE